MFEFYNDRYVPLREKRNYQRLMKSQAQETAFIYGQDGARGQQSSACGRSRGQQRPSCHRLALVCPHAGAGHRLPVWLLQGLMEEVPPLLAL